MNEPASTEQTNLPSDGGRLEAEQFAGVLRAAEAQHAAPAADESAIRRFLFYTLSLPERTLRSSVGLVSGLAKETTSLLIPRAFQNAKTYQIMVAQTLDFLVQDVGGVKPASKAGEDPEADKVDNFVARKAVGNFVETAGLLTFHVSPLMILAVVSDVAYGSTAYLRELATEMKRRGVIDENSTINHVDDLLSAVGSASGTTASAFDTPPLSVDGLKNTIAQTREAVTQIDPTKLIPKAEIQRMWSEMKEIATRDGVNVFTVSTAMTMNVLGKVGNFGRGTLAGVSVAGGMLKSKVFDHYADALRDVQAKGVFASLKETSGPYVAAVWNNFSSGKSTITESIVSGRLFARMWRWMKGCLQRNKQGNISKGMHHGDTEARSVDEEQN